MDKPGAERVFPDVEAVRADLQKRLAIAKDPTAYRESLPGGQARGERGGK
jgi:hypothetical protein